MSSDYYPIRGTLKLNQTPEDEVAVVRRVLDKELGNLPDIDMRMFQSFEDYVTWIMEGRQRFSCQ